MTCTQNGKVLVSYTRKIFYNSHIKPHTDKVSLVWDGCSEVHLKKLNFLHQSGGIF